MKSFPGSFLKGERSWIAWRWNPNPSLVPSLTLTWELGYPSLVPRPFVYGRGRKGRESGRKGLVNNLTRPQRGLAELSVFGRKMDNIVRVLYYPWPEVMNTLTPDSREQLCRVRAGE